MHIDGFQPSSVVRPASVDEIGQLIRQAGVGNTALYPVGGGTSLYLGNAPVKPGVAVDLRGMDQVIDYPARDMTITVQAGITLSKLQQILDSENQRLPIDVPQPEHATIGGAIAVNAFGPRRFGFGTLRDYLIGVHFMSDGGVEAKAGGRVVKNVAGYDLCKLHTGAFGTLGILTKATLKLKPKPEESRLVVFRMAHEHIASALEEVHASQTRPVCIDLATASDEAILSVGFEDNREAVGWQVERIKNEIASGSLISVDDGFERVLQFNEGELGFRANMVPSAVPEFLAGLRRYPHLQCRCHAGNGIVHGNWRGVVAKEEAERAVLEWRRLAQIGSGSVVVTRCPAEWKRDLVVWGEPRGDRALMREVKRALDPKDLFNPGRFIV